MTSLTCRGLYCFIAVVALLCLNAPAHASDVTKLSLSIMHGDFNNKRTTFTYTHYAEFFGVTTVGPLNKTLAEGEDGTSSIHFVYQSPKRHAHGGFVDLTRYSMGDADSVSVKLNLVCAGYQYQYARFAIQPFIGLGGCGGEYDVRLNLIAEEGEYRTINNYFPYDSYTPALRVGLSISLGKSFGLVAMHRRETIDIDHDEDQDDDLFSIGEYSTKLTGKIRLHSNFIGLSFQF